MADDTLPAEFNDEKSRRHRQELFTRLDLHGRGKLDAAGLQEGLREIKHPLANADAVLRKIMRFADKNSDGYITADEFDSFIEQAERQLWTLFSDLDTSDNGTLEFNEVEDALQSVGIYVPSDALHRFFNKMDENNDGEVDYGEFRDFLLFMPSGIGGAANMRLVYTYLLNNGGGTGLSSEGDVVLSLRDFFGGMRYFLAGGAAGAVSRTCTAPFDRLKVYLIARTQNSDVLEDVKNLQPGKAANKLNGSLVAAVKDVYRAGGIRSFFVGNGLNVLKIVPESAIRFGSFEGMKKTFASFEGASSVDNMSAFSRFIAGGLAGAVSQMAVYPLDTLKFRIQAESTAGAQYRGTALLRHTASRMWQSGGSQAFYRGLPLGIGGIFPYSAIDLFAFEAMKRAYAKKYSDTAGPGNMMVLAFGAVSGSVGASIVYPINLVRTRYQAQGTASLPYIYDGVWDCARRTYKFEGIKGFYRGLIPNLLKVAPSVSISYLVYERLKAL